MKWIARKIWPISALVCILVLSGAGSGPALAQMPQSGPRSDSIGQDLTRTGLVPDTFQAGLQAYNEGRQEQAVRLWRPLAESGYVLAQYNLGLAYARGTGVPRDIVAAARWWEKAARQGNTDAQYNLGLVYIRGHGIARNPGLAAHWWTQAALGGDAAAQYNLGMMYARGEGVEYDLKSAISWWQRAADQGFERADRILKELAAKKLIVRNTD